MAGKSRVRSAPRPGAVVLPCLLRVASLEETRRGVRVVDSPLFDQALTAHRLRSREEQRRAAALSWCEAVIARISETGYRTSVGGGPVCVIRLKSDDAGAEKALPHDEAEGSGLR